MAYTEYFQFTSGLTLYGKARPYNATWATGVVAMSENGSTGEYSSSSFVDDTQYGVFIRLGGSPASSDTPIGSIYPTPAGLDASGIRSAVGLASANLDDQLSDVDTALAGIPEPPSESSIVAAINADATQTTARTNAATAATQATTAATQTEPAALRTAVGLESANLANLVNAVIGKKVVTPVGDGRFDIAVRNAADSATLVTVRHNPVTGDTVIL